MTMKRNGTESRMVAAYALRLLRRGTHISRLGLRATAKSLQKEYRLQAG
jgi:hypothetical protein